jgi:hypothetical protein
MFYCKKFYVRVLVGVLIKWLYEMHGVKIKWDTDVETKLSSTCQNCAVAEPSVTLQFPATFKVYNSLYIWIWYYLEIKHSVTRNGSNVALMMINLNNTVHFVRTCVLLKQFTVLKTDVHPTMVHHLYPSNFTLSS